MRIPRIYTANALEPGSRQQLEPGPSQHLSRALRMEAGAQLLLFNGDGFSYAATISAVGKRAVEVCVGQPREENTESPLSVHLGIAISRGERMDWVVQKATELGIATISPLHTERTGVQLKGERREKKLRHWQQVAISACEQCGRNRLPAIAAPAGLASWIADTRAERRLVLHHRAGAGIHREPIPSTVALLVGPEGGFSAAEIKLAEAAGFEALALGPRVLRTETAPLAALAILQARWGDMGL